MKTIKLYALCFLVFLFTKCKKEYPENTIRKKDLKNIEFLNSVRLTGFSVNGIDSLSLLNSYFGSRVLKKDMKNTAFIYGLHNGERMIHFGTVTSTIGEIPVTYVYSKDKKQIKFMFGANEPLDTTIYHRNLFLNSDYWDILKFEFGGTRKIRKTVNGNTYLLQFTSF